MAYSIMPGIPLSDLTSITVTLPEETSKVSFENKVIKYTYNVGFASGIRTIMADIADVSVIRDGDGNPKVVVVEFTDGAKEKAVVSKDDTFSLEQGISICIAKKLLSDKTNDNGSSTYNKIVRHALKVYDAKQKAESAAREQEAQEKARMEKLAAKRKAKREKQEAKAREDFINLEAEAMLRALKEYRRSGIVDAIDRNVK